VYVVLSGAVLITALSWAGREVVLAILGPGQAFGQSGLIGHGHRGTARAVRATWILEVPAGAATGPPRTGGSDWLVLALAARVDQLETWLGDIGLRDVPGRVARRLCELMDGHGVRDHRGVTIDLPITQGQLAAAAGATRESVNRCLRTLVAMGIVQHHGRRYVVTDEGALRAAARDC